jgi:hypothetical protein
VLRVVLPWLEVLECGYRTSFRWQCEKDLRVRMHSAWCCDFVTNLCSFNYQYSYCALLRLFADSCVGGLLRR